MPDTSAVKIAAHPDNPQLIRVTLNNPARHNAISYEMWRELTKVMIRLAKDHNVRAVILDGSGNRAFCAGADISEFGHWRANSDRRHEYNRTTAAGAASLKNFPKPLIACIDGYCIGAGFEIALQCDIRLCSESAVFAVTPAKLGLGYNLDDTQLIVDQLGASAAREILFSGRRYKASDGLRLGIVSQIHADAELSEYADRFGLEIAANAPLSVQASKAIIHEAAKLPNERDHELCKTLVDRCYESHDFIEGQTAFNEKRKPVFTGT